MSSLLNIFTFCNATLNFYIFVYIFECYRSRKNILNDCREEIKYGCKITKAPLSQYFVILVEILHKQILPVILNSGEHRYNLTLTVHLLLLPSFTFFLSH